MVYDGFISYSHAADGRLAPALQQGLQRLAKPWTSRRALRIFRDETGLATNPHLWSAITTALDESTWFVLLASPDSARSEWVNKEIAHWLATKSVDRILPVVSEGTWEWNAAASDFRDASDAVPYALRGAFRAEPRHLDLRWAHDETDLDLRNSRFRGAVADLAAPMHGIAKDELEGEDIRQHRRAQRLARTGATVVALLLVVSIVFGAFAVVQRGHAKDAQAAAEDEALQSDAQRLGTLALTEPNLDRSLLLAVAGVRLKDLPETRGDLLAVLQKTPAVFRQIVPSHGDITAIAVSPKGRLFASGDSAGIVRFDELRSWSPDGAAVRLAGSVSPQAMAFSPDGTAIVVGVAASPARSDLYIIDVAARRAELVKSFPSRPAAAGPLRFTHLAFSPDGEHIAVAVASAAPSAPLPTTERLAVLAARDRRVVWERAYPLRPGQQETYVAFASPDALVTSSPQGETLVWNATTGRIERRFPIGGNVAVSPDGAVAALGQNNADPTQPSSTMTLVDLHTGTVRSLEPVPARAWIVSVLFTPDNNDVIAGTFDGAVREWDRRSGAITQTFTGQPSGFSVAVTPDGQTMLSGAQNGSVAAWDLGGAQRLGSTFQWNAPDKGCPTTPCFVINPHGTLMATVQSDGSVALIDLRTRQLSKTLPARNGAEADALAFAPDGRMLATGGTAGRVTFWDTRTGSVERSLSLGVPVWWVAVSPDGKTVAIETQARNDPEAHVEVRDLTSGTTLYRRSLSNGHRGLYFSPDGRELAALGCCESGSTINVRDARSGRALFSPRVDGHATSIAFSPDSRMLAAGTEDGRVVLYSTVNGRTLGSPIQVATAAVDPISFSPDGRTFAVSATDGTATIWDVGSRKRLGNSFPVEQGVIPAAHFAPNGDLVIDYLADAARWPTNVERWATFACQVAGRDLTRAEWTDLLPKRPYQHLCSTHP